MHFEMVDAAPDDDRNAQCSGRIQNLLNKSERRAGLRAG